MSNPASIVRLSTLAALSFLSLAGCHGASAAARRVFVWPSPPGWKQETFPFPLDFAPTIDHRGTEEVRFAPHFFDTSAPTYFSYSFAWVLESTAPIDPETLGTDLVSYFKGLARAVGADKHASYPDSAFSAHLEGAGEGRVSGVVMAVDPFSDGRALKLNTDVESSLCQGHRVVLVTLSPQLPTSEVWQNLLEQRRSFQCVALVAR